MLASTAITSTMTVEIIGLAPARPDDLGGLGAHLLEEGESDWFFRP